MPFRGEKKIPTNPPKGTVGSNVTKIRMGGFLRKSHFDLFRFPRSERFCFARMPPQKISGLWTASPLGQGQGLDGLSGSRPRGCLVVWLHKNRLTRGGSSFSCQGSWLGRPHGDLPQGSGWPSWVNRVIRGSVRFSCQGSASPDSVLSGGVLAGVASAA